MEETTRPTPVTAPSREVMTPETAPHPGVTPVNPSIEREAPAEAPSETENAITNPPPSAEGGSGLAGGIITPLTTPINGGIGDVAAIPCILDPVGHGYVVMQVLSNENAPVQITSIPPVCQEQHPMDDALAAEYVTRARSVVNLAATSRRQGAVAVPPATVGAVITQTVNAEGAGDS